MEFSSLIQDLRSATGLQAPKRARHTAEAPHGLIRHREGGRVRPAPEPPELPMCAELAGWPCRFARRGSTSSRLERPEGGARRDYASELSGSPQREDPQTRPRPEEYSHRACLAGDPPSGTGLTRQALPLNPRGRATTSPRRPKFRPRADPGKEILGSGASPVACRCGSERMKEYTASAPRS
jgi:hypothetical protein